MTSASRYCFPFVKIIISYQYTKKSLCQLITLNVTNLTILETLIFKNRTDLQKFKEIIIEVHSLWLHKLLPNLHVFYITM